MNVDIEGWLETNGYDISEQTLSDEKWDKIEEEAEDQAQLCIEDDMDNIGQEIVMIFNLKKKQTQNPKQGNKEIK